MDGPMPSWNNNFDIISSDESSSDSDMAITDSLPAKLLPEIPILEPKVEKEIAQASIGIITPQDALIKRAEMYQEYMKQIPIPTHRGSVVPFNSWTGLGNSIKNMYGQPLHYLTNSQLNQWDRLRIGADDEYDPLDSIIHPSKAEATIWLLEEVHRRTASHHNVAKLWLSDPMHYAFVDSIFPKLENA